MPNYSRQSFSQQEPLAADATLEHLLQQDPQLRLRFQEFLTHLQETSAFQPYAEPLPAAKSDFQASLETKGWRWLANVDPRDSPLTQELSSHLAGDVLLTLRFIYRKAGHPSVLVCEEAFDVQGRRLPRRYAVYVR